MDDEQGYSGANTIGGERGTRTLDLGIMTFAMLVGVQPARRFTIAVAQRELPDAFFGSASWTRTCRDFGP